VLLWMVIAVGISSVVHGDTVDLSVINGRSLVSLQTTFCTDEFWLAASPSLFPDLSRMESLKELQVSDDGSTTKLNANQMIFEDGDDLCEGGYYEMDGSDSFVFTRTLATATIEINVGKGLFGRMPVGGNITCGKRRLLSSIEFPGIFLFLERGLIKLSESNTGVEKTFEISEKTAALIGEMQFLGELKAPQACFQSYDEPLIPEEVCFPSNSMVKMADGSEKRMKELRIGDQVKTSVGNDEVFLFTHKMESRLAEFVHLEVKENRFIRLSKQHLIVVDNRKTSLVAAEDVKVGDFLMFTENESTERVQVIKKSIVKDIGVYHPHTLSGELIVNGFLVSSYSTLLTPSVSNVLLLPPKLLYLIFNTKVPAVNSMLSIFNTDPPRFLHSILAFLNKISLTLTSQSS